MAPFSSLQKCSSAHWSSPVFTFTPEVPSPLLHPSPLSQSWLSILIPSSVSFPSHCPLHAVLSHLPKAGHSILPFPIPLSRSELPICFPLSLCIIPQSFSSHPVPVHVYFYTSQPVTADCFYFAGTHSELLPPSKSVALIPSHMPPNPSCCLLLPWPLAALAHI